MVHPNYSHSIHVLSLIKPISHSCYYFIYFFTLFFSSDYKCKTCPGTIIIIKILRSKNSSMPIFWYIHLKCTHKITTWKSEETLAVTNKREILHLTELFGLFTLHLLLVMACSLTGFRSETLVSCPALQHQTSDVYRYLIPQVFCSWRPDVLFKQKLNQKQSVGKIMLDLHLLNGQKKKIWIWIL